MIDYRRVSVVILVCFGCSWTVRGEDITVKAITRPSDNVTLSFVTPGRVAEIAVKPGQAVKKGQLLARLDDEAERLKLRQLKVQAEDTTRIKAAEAQLAQKKVDFARISDLAAKQVASRFELDSAKLDVTIADLSLALAKLEHDQDVLKYQEAKSQIGRMSITSPIDGKVEDVIAQVGQSVDIQAKIITVVAIDPLWADAPVPVDQAAHLKTGEAVKVDFGNGRVVDSKIIFIAAVADAASQTRTIRVEIPNKESKGGGDHVMINFPTAVAKANTP